MTFAQAEEAVLRKERNAISHGTALFGAWALVEPRRMGQRASHGPLGQRCASETCPPTQTGNRLTHDSNILFHFQGGNQGGLSFLSFLVLSCLSFWLCSFINSTPSRTHPSTLFLPRFFHSLCRHSSTISLRCTATRTPLYLLIGYATNKLGRPKHQHHTP